MYDGKAYIGWTYVDPNKGPCMKGEIVDGLAPDKIKELLHAKFPSSSLEPLEDGQQVTPLSDAELKQLDLPAQPDWYADYKKVGGAI